MCAYVTTSSFLQVKSLGRPCISLQIESYRITTCISDIAVCLEDDDNYSWRHLIGVN